MRREARRALAGVGVDAALISEAARLGARAKRVVGDDVVDSGQGVQPVDAVRARMIAPLIATPMAAAASATLSSITDSMLRSP